MNKKFLSSLLLGLLVVGATGTVTSCKDYDDDINANAQEIASLKTKLDEQVKVLQAAIDQAKADAAAAHATFATKSDLEALQKEVAKLVTADQLATVKKELEDAIATKADKSVVDGILVKIDAIDSRLNVVETKLANLEDAVKAATDNIALQETALKKLQEALDGKAGQADVDKLNEDVAKLLEDMANVKVAVGDTKAIEELREEMKKANDLLDKKLSSNINLLTVLINKQLSSLVLMPSFYWEGLEGIEVPAIYNTPVYSFDGTTKFTYKVPGASGYEEITITADNKQPVATPKTVTIQDGAIARYHVDPTSASFEDATFSFFTNEAEVYTRAGGAFATPKKDTFDGTVNKVEDGVLTIPFKVDFAKLDTYYKEWVASANNDPVDANNDWTDVDGESSYGGKLPFIALQTSYPKTENREAQTVTSDYAVVTPAKVKLVALADNDPETVLDQNTFISGNPEAGVIGNNHLYTTLYGTNGEEYGKTLADAQTHGVLTMPATHSVVYNKTIDLKPFIETHADYITFAKYGKAKHDYKMTADELEALGLKYKFTIVNYRHGEEKTSESAHIEQIEDGVFAPRSVNADGTTITGKVATREVIDREPLVRVDLVDAEGNVVLYGYIKLRIVAAELADKVVEAPLDEIYMNCGDKGKMTWSQVENLILSKLGTEGLTKQEFEKNYYLEVINGKTVMPTIADGSLYTESWQAVRYSDSKVSAKLADQDAAYGRVWYTPHDNATDPQAWDAQTNVLEWNLTDDAVAGKMNAAKYKKFMEEYGVTYASKGENTKEASTWVRFINKVDGTNIWVKLFFAPNKIHFEYGKVANKDLHHWFQFNSSYVPGTESDLDVHANTPTPAEVAQVDLTNAKFDKDLREYWVNKTMILTLEGKKDKFTKFYNTDGTVKTKITYEFTLPKKGVNSTISATGNTWVVEGASGSKWTLELGDNNHTIYAIKQNGLALAQKEKVAELKQNADDGTYTVLHYFGDEDDNKNAATDLINKMGRRDNTGADIMKSYLTDNIDKTFTAYVEIKASEDPCYAPLLANNFFNVRVLRPINVWPKNIKWTDALNQTEKVKIEDLINIVDWRDYKVLVNGNYAEGQVPYSFYGISDLAVIREDIRSDAQLSYEVRSGDPLTDVAQIKALKSVEEIPSLTSYKNESGITTATYLKLKNAAGTEVYNSSIHGLSGNGWTEGNMAGKKYGTIEYTNNGAGAQIFHIYVPIAVKYNWGNVINKKTNASTSGVDKKLNYTQVVWVTITVNKTTGSGAKKQ